MHVRWSAGVAAAAVSGALLLPSTAIAQTNGIPPIPVDARHPNACSAVKANLRITVGRARTARQAAYASANAAWVAGVADEQQQLNRALAAAHSRRQVTHALAAYRAATADERAARMQARQQARATFRAVKKQALRTFRKGWATCH